MNAVQAAVPIEYWVEFLLFILFMICLDMFVFHKKAHEVSMKEAAGWSVFWIALALVFNVLVYKLFGSQRALEFFTAYLIEKSLSVDNLFVFIMIFSYFSVPRKYQHRVLFWGIIGAIVMRGIFIAVGTALIQRFAWILYLFGLFLVFTAIKMVLHRDEEIHPERNPLLKLFAKFMPSVHEYHEEHFFVKKEAKGKLVWHATPLVLVLITIESSDVVFAVDSIPAVLVISQDPFIVFTSNIFAILGLRALFFLLASMLSLFKRLKEGVAFILFFIGIKMLINHFYHIPIMISLVIIAFTLVAAIIISIMEDRQLKKKQTGGNNAR